MNALEGLCVTAAVAMIGVLLRQSLKRTLLLNIVVCVIANWVISHMRERADGLVWLAIEACVGTVIAVLVTLLVFVVFRGIRWR